jgi:hypothetical protein
MKKETSSKIKAGLGGFFKPILQLFKSLSNKQLNLFLFLLIPVVYLVVVTMSHYSRGLFYMRSVDPEYFYMYNGIVLGAGNLSIQYFAHPGTPLHFLIAFSSRIIDLFQPGNYMENFVNDPEKYIHTANLSLNILIAVVIFICGKLTLKYTGSIKAALFMQVSPFAGFGLLTMSGRLIPESMIMIPLLFMGLMVLKNTFEDEMSRNTRRDIVLYGLITGFGMACKLTFIPVIVLPLILLKTSVREKLIFVLYTILFFVIFAYPLFFNLSESWEWISGIFMHSGKYGTGESNFIDLSSVGKNLDALFKYSSGFFIMMICTLAISLLLLSRPARKFFSPDMRILRAVLSLNITILVCIAAVLKHFEIYYFVPFTIFKILLFLLTVLLIIRLKPVSGIKALQWPLWLVSFVILIFILVPQVKQFRSVYQASEIKSKAITEESNRILAFIDKEKPIIVSGSYYGSPFVEFAQYNGYVMSGHLKGFYTDYLRKKFPNYYNCLDWSTKYDHWNEFVEIKDILAKVKSSFYIYIGEGKEGDLPEIEAGISKVLDLNNVVTRILYREPETGEQLIEIIVNP